MFILPSYLLLPKAIKYDTFYFIFPFRNNDPKIDLSLIAINDLRITNFKHKSSRKKLSHH